MPLMYINEGEDWLEAYKKRKPKPWHEKIKKRTFLFWGVFLGLGMVWLWETVPGWLAGIEIGVRLF